MIIAPKANKISNPPMRRCDGRQPAKSPSFPRQACRIGDITVKAIRITRTAANVTSKKNGTNRLRSPRVKLTKKVVHPLSN